MTCPYTYQGAPCTLADRNHYDCHITADKERFTDRGSDQGQKAA